MNWFRLFRSIVANSFSKNVKEAKPTLKDEAHQLANFLSEKKREIKKEDEKLLPKKSVKE